MPNTIKRGNVGTTPFGDYITKRGAVSTAQVFFPNAMIGLTAAGWADKMDDAAVKTFDGVLASASTEVLAGGANGDVLLDVNQPRFITVAIAAAAPGDVGRRVYAVDDQTVAFAPGAFGNFVGRVAAVLSATAVVVEAHYFQAGGGGNSALLVLAGDGAVPVKAGTVLLTKGTAAALTLAAPAAGADDGKVLELVSTTAAAHVVTCAGVGFNAKGATGTATFGAARGNSFRVVAYQGNWYADGGPNGVTIA
ncbi:hypothetical protein GobsT_63690 [Gemmata obscuriglobus]|uniref:Uncharacterized protein n=1 Tax=Gemmata obscuriglobus TaxID=114 RepID=A0A2Z3GNS8_9BACT|nr:hypothetical protein [Gemmata obscuriglobus]AWM35899.1 hypothetical protein C1280_01990 [Gemmata obscuriglobus]QEG31547.1 hypothetical protein GobsT_63690 [Gemmata obscuriglobus]VTS10889.1 Uncharacterized protein OS=Chthoniobacter flavus Ellin428 GN=CfE428DRAFT_5533 PE=4 SV=1 [Gemmata obscuriglobus UQM 2246]